MEDKLVKEVIFNHPIDKVWKAITQGSEISKWFISADFKAEVGYKYRFTATEEHGSTQISGTVLEANPYTLKYSWKVGEAPIETIVSWKLESQGATTKLLLEHTGISKIGGKAAVEAFNHFSMGWDACLSVLPNYLNGEATQPAH
ncbi:SRPBCC family protein [Fulvivirga lutimaris]|uniref:SRPBCC family protein n=1 Tax=Fulvivirga lutimaris TaxID=1819566 RepID=UPI001629626E|nr:SRPBCC domain-containing protein [Fulvivirga lutimaris]